jgi:hypothetical protein
MNLYRKHDLINMLYYYSDLFGSEFFYDLYHEAVLQDIFYVAEGTITVNEKPEEAYSIIFYFGNGVSLTPYRFSLLNSTAPAFRTFSCIPGKDCKEK